MDCGSSETSLTADLRSCSDSKSQRLSLSVKRLNGNTLRRFVIFYLHWSGSDVTTLLYLEIKAQDAEGNSEKGVRECKKPWEMSHHSASVLLSFTSPTFHCQSQFAGMGSPTLARNETSPAPWHIPSPYCRPSLPYSSLCSHHHHLPAHQRPGREAVRITWSPYSPPSYFVANLDSPPSTAGLPVPNLSLERGESQTGGCDENFSTSGLILVFLFYLLSIPSPTSLSSTFTAASK